MNRIEFISFEEYQKIYKAEKDKKIRLALMLGFGSGLRISEIIGLREYISPCCSSPLVHRRIKVGTKLLKKDVCTQCDGIILTNKAKLSKDSWRIKPLTSDKISLESHQIRIDEAKGNKWRVTIVPPTLTEEYLKLLPLDIPRRTLQFKFDNLTKQILNKKMSFHILRHGFGNYQANILKLPLPIVQQMMGHSRLDTTGIYTKVNPENAIKQAWDAMSSK